ncbi:MAG: o-succinylbenzoate synthase [Patescibacteria group bacterium]|nr:o-succinylbenzoate synthase [Patescibacteria group bacterium]MDE2588682.1 o-succinylbenzoate synthase [Patescibacteria group bacterium]
MKIKKITLYQVEIPMVTSFTTSFGTITKKPTVIVKIQTDKDIIAFGESAAMPFPFYNPETTTISLLVLKDYITPLVLNKEFETIEQLMQMLSSIKGNNFAKTGLETAVWMAMSLQKNKSIKELLGGSREKIGVGESIGIKSTIEETFDEVALRLKQGFQRIKIKIKPNWDIQLIEALRDKFKDIPLMIDANSSYTLGDLSTLKKMDACNLLMTEQPLADDDIVDHAVLQQEITTPICLDESIHSAEDARRAIYIKACKIINIKPGRVGGLLESKKIHDLCQENNIDVWCGGMLETGIGRAFNIAVASLPNCIYPADMSPVSFFYVDDLVTNSFTVDVEGFVQVPTTPGLGFTVDEKKIDKYSTATICF